MASRLANEGKAETIGQLRERLATVEAELEALKTSQSPGAANLTAESLEPTARASSRPEALSGPWWRRPATWIAPGIAAIALALSLVVVALSVLR
jgi:hypothetical protein